MTAVDHDDGVWNVDQAFLGGFKKGVAAEGNHVGAQSF
jgi:hypothetical protein